MNVWWIMGNADDADWADKKMNVWVDYGERR